MTDNDQLLQIVKYSDRLLQKVTDAFNCDKLQKIVTKRRLYGMSGILVSHWDMHSIQHEPIIGVGLMMV